MTLIGIIDILDKREPAQTEADYREVGSKTYFISQGVSPYGRVKPWWLKLSSHEEIKKQNYLCWRLKSPIYKASELGQKAVVMLHLLIPLDREDYPQETAAPRSYWIHEEEHGNFQRGDPPGHIVLEAHSQEVHNVQHGGSVVQKEDDHCFLDKPPGEE